VEAESQELWDSLARVSGLSANRLGVLPAPTPVPPDADPDARMWLAYVREAIKQAGQERPMPSWSPLVLAMLGAAGAATAYAIGEVLRWIGRGVGGDVAVGLPVLALVATLLGPVVGLGPARLLADRRGAALDARAVAIVVIAGVVTIGLLFTVIQSG
jgi:hypothetical protein